VEPQFDVVALADDLRLGMFVIARLATRHGIAVTLRSSPYGGTTAIVLVPHDIVVREGPTPDADAAGSGSAAASVAEAAVPAQRGPETRTAREPEEYAEPTAALAENSTGTPGPDSAGPDSADTQGPGRHSHARSRVAQPATRPRTADTGGTGFGPGSRSATGSGSAPGSGRSAGSGSGSGSGPGSSQRSALAPLPRRVPQTSLATELLEDSVPARADDPLEDFDAERAASSLSGFQRGTLRARDDAEEWTYDEGGNTAEEAPQASPGTQVPVPGKTVTSTPPADRS
jgi:hypothetical protein